VGFIPVGNADNAKIRYIVVDPGIPIILVQRAKCIAADAELKIARFEANGPGLGNVPSLPGLIYQIGTAVTLDNISRRSLNQYKAEKQYDR
jgi:hypothetical protein